jgi:membrane-anchored protein YejM (alkaline phosphatase superfamily)
MSEVPKVCFYDLKVLFPFVGQHFFSKFLVYRHVVQKKLPRVTSLRRQVLWNTVPSSIFELIYFYVRLLGVQNFIYFDCLLFSLRMLDFIQNGFSVLVLFLLRIGLMSSIVIPEVFKTIFKFLST